MEEEIGHYVMGAANVLFDPDRRVLLVRHSYGALNWEIPGGGAMPGEDPGTTAQRELLEETGLDLEPQRMTGVYFEVNHRFGPIMHFVFRVLWQPGLVPVAVAPEITDVGFWPIDDLPRPISDFTERRILDALCDEAPFAVIEKRVWLP